MKYYKIGIAFICTGLIFLLISFFFLLQAITITESWAVAYFITSLPFLLLAVLDIIFGFLTLIMKKAYDFLSIYFGVLNSIMGFLFSYYGLLLFIPGIIMFYLGLKEED